MKINLKKLLLILLLIIPLSTLAYSSKVIPGGSTIGIEVNSSGILVVGFYKVEDKYIAKDAGFKVNDRIIKVNNEEVNNIKEMVDIINKNNDNKISFIVQRDNKEKEVILNINSKSDEVLKTGMYVKDKIIGVGTLSYIDPESKIFASLGHEIIESNTNTKFEIKDGSIYEAKVTNIVRSRKGRAGEKNATYDKEETIGIIKDNNETGIYGKYISEVDNTNTMEIGDSNIVTTGQAIIRTVIENNNTEDFTINIIKIINDNPTKNILFEITDQRLLNKTGGIIQGMSGSPIIQNNKLIGAVNYVIVDEPTKGYGIFITTMLEEGDKKGT